MLGKSCLVRAFHQWATSYYYTPMIYIIKETNKPSYCSNIPENFIKNKEIILNFSKNAVTHLSIDDEKIRFYAPFDGEEYAIEVAINDIDYLMTKEAGWLLSLYLPSYFINESSRNYYEQQREDQAKFDRNHVLNNKENAASKNDLAKLTGLASGYQWSKKILLILMKMKALLDSEKGLCPHYAYSIDTSSQALEKFFMQPRIIERLIAIYEPTLELLDTPWMQHMLNVITAQNVFFTQEHKTVLFPISLFKDASISIHALLAKLDEDFIAWEKAIQDNAGKGISAFLDAADSITDKMAENLKLLVAERKKHIRENIHVLPVNLKESIKTLRRKKLEIDSMISKLGAPHAKAIDICHLLWKRAQNIQWNNTEELNDSDALPEMRICKEDLGKAIWEYQNQVRQLIIVYDELIDIESGGGV